MNGAVFVSKVLKRRASRMLVWTAYPGLRILSKGLATQAFLSDLPASGL